MTWRADERMTRDELALVPCHRFFLLSSFYCAFLPCGWLGFHCNRAKAQWYKFHGVTQKYSYHQNIHGMKDKQIFLWEKKFLISDCFFLQRFFNDRLLEGVKLWASNFMNLFACHLALSTLSAKSVLAVVGGPSWLLPQSPSFSLLGLSGCVDISPAMSSTVPYLHDCKSTRM